MTPLRYPVCVALTGFVLFAGCGDRDNGNTLDAATTGPDAMNNPPNPSGLGPAPVALGSSTDLAAAGSYVLLAKTGITNVTGSAITGGYVGLRPAASA